MADSTVWWIAAGLLVAAELLTGTFYLLMLAIGAAAGALAAHAGLSLSAQLVAGGVT
ncbi:MAG TPA: NfeD family protein, partial [Ottowia sp.]|nr:NfeD family protein [Ottowia sp.]